MESGRLVNDQALLRVKFSALSFVSGLAPTIWTHFFSDEWTVRVVFGRFFWTSVVSLIFGKCLFPRYYDVWWRALVTGLGVSFGIMLFVFPGNGLDNLGAYFCILSVFHYLEYVVTGLTNPSNLSTDSFLLNHSKQYWLAATASWLEYFIERFFFPSLKQMPSICALGILTCGCGDVLRKLAMFHAGNSFSHIVQSSKKDDHQLVTTGVFAVVRHPSYVGWFLWSIGTQIVLANPICLIVYTFVSWSFFNERIFVEEYSLLQFFGECYEDYQAKVPSGIPFVKGFVIGQPTVN